MKCPRCFAETGQVELKSIKVDRCTQCGGVWFDYGELRLLKDKEDRGDYRWIDLDLWKDRDRFRSAEQEGLPCPVNGTPMMTVHYGDSDIHVDICYQQHGLWLDKGEFEQIITYLAREVDTQSLGDYVKDVWEEFAEIFTGPEGGRSELGDLGRVLYLLQLRFAVQFPDLAATLRAIGRGTPGNV